MFLDLNSDSLPTKFMEITSISKSDIHTDVDEAYVVKRLARLHACMADAIQVINRCYSMQVYTDS